MRQVLPYLHDKRPPELGAARMRRADSQAFQVHFGRCLDMHFPGADRPLPVIECGLKQNGSPLRITNEALQHTH